jgi:predicted Zn-dependent protease
MITTQAARELAHAVVQTALSAGATTAETIVFGNQTALTRFANNRVHQNVASEDTELQVRAVIGDRIGVASTNRANPEGIRACCERAVDAARHSPADPDFPGLPAARPVEQPDRADATTLAFDPTARATAVKAIVGECLERGLVAAGSVSADHSVTAVANSLGVDAAMPTAMTRVTVLASGEDSASGWASFASRGAGGLDAAALGREAAGLALRSARPATLEAGVYKVVLAPEAVADIAQFLGWYGAGAKTVAEGRSFMTGRLGQRLVSPLITLADDALDPSCPGLTFDYEGQPKQRTELIGRGVAIGPVTDSYWAAKAGRANTGHALPAPSRMGPIPLDLELEAGDADVAAMIASVTHGVYVTRFHYVNISDPVRVELTGMTRDGTFLIENGALSHPVRNLRFTQSAIEALDATLAVSAARVRTGEDGRVLAPHLLLERFTFTGQTE